MTSSYSILATVTIMHDYYADGRSLDFEIMATSATAAALKGCGILYRQLGNALVLLVKVDDDESTYIELPTDLVLSFYLKLNSPNFLNITNLSLPADSILYFTNSIKTKVGTTLYLNRPLPAFSNANSYAIGDLVIDGGAAFEAMKPMTPGSHGTGETDFWFPRNGDQYVNPTDALLKAEGFINLSVTSTNLVNTSIFGLNPATQLYTLPVRTEQQIFLQNRENVSVSLRDLKPGKYRITANSTEKFIYVDPQAKRGIVGVIELFNLFPPADDFGWVDASGVPKETDYIIRFPNRLAIWKYITRTTQVTAVEVISVPNAFIAGPQPKQFLSVLPMPLRETPLKTLQLMKGATILASKLANPPPSRISTVLDGGGNKYFCAEMYLNY